MRPGGSSLATTKMLKELDEFLEAEMDDFFNGPFMMRPRLSFLQRPVRYPDAEVRPSSNKYKITNKKDSFQVMADVPGVDAENLNVQLEQNGRVLRLSGKREIKNGEASFESRFDKAFVLDRSVDTEKITANLADGVITITAPKRLSQDSSQRIEITKGNHDDAAEEMIDTSIPYDAAARLAYDRSDKAMTYEEFKAKFEADAVADVMAKRSKVLKGDLSKDPEKNMSGKGEGNGRGTPVEEKKWPVRDFPY